MGVGGAVTVGGNAALKVWRGGIHGARGPWSNVWGRGGG